MRSGNCRDAAGDFAAFMCRAGGRCAGSTALPRRRRIMDEQSSKTPIRAQRVERRVAPEVQLKVKISDGLVLSEESQRAVNVGHPEVGLR